MDDSSTESSFALSSYVRGPVVRRQRSDSDDAHALQRHGDHATSTPPQNATPKSDIQVESEDRPVADPEPGDVHGEPVADGGPPAGNSDEARTADHPATHHGDDLGFIAPKTMKIVLKGKPFHISVAPNDDVKLMAAKFIIDQKIKPEAKSLIEGELVKTQLDATLSHVKKLYKNNTTLLRQAAGFKAMEQRALAAESHAQKLAEALDKMKLCFPPLQSLVQGAVSSATEYSESAAGLLLEHSELQRKFDKLFLENDSATKRAKELTKEIVLKEDNASLLLFESTEKGLEVERLRKELEVAVAEAAVATTAAEVAIAEKEHTERLIKKRNLNITATASRSNATTHRSSVQMKVELESHAQIVSDLRGKIKLLETKLAHSISKMEVAEVSRDAMHISNQQLKHNLEKSNSRVALVAQQLKESEQELQRLKENTSLELEHLLKERKALKEDIFQDREKNSALMKELNSMRGLVRDAIEAMVVSRDRGPFRTLAARLDIAVGWSPDTNDGGAVGDGEEVVDDIILEQQIDQQAELDTEVAISFIGSIDQQSAPDSDKGKLCQFSGTEENVRVTPNPIRRLWNSVSVPETDNTYTDDHTVLSVSLDSRDHAAAVPGVSPETGKASRGNLNTPDMNVSFDFSSEIRSTQKSSPSRLAKSYTGKFQGLSPVVEDRLLRSIFAKYTSESKGVLRASRFLRFAKEYNICVHEHKSGVEVLYGGHENLKLSTGDIDVIFAIALKKTELANSNLHINHGGSEALRRAWGANRKARIGGEANTLNYPQFLEALYLCGERMYTAVIEKETGTVIDCLPTSQRAAASRSAFEVMLVKNLACQAEEHGIMPWPLLYLDQTVSLLHFDAEASITLARYARALTMWFGRAAGRKVAAPEHGGVAGIFVGITYKELSTVCHSSELVPHLVHEHELYRIFEEVMQWCLNDIKVLVENLPEEIKALHHVSNEISARLLNQSQALKKLLGFVGFIYVIVTVATQGFQHAPIEHRLDYLFERTGAGRINGDQPRASTRDNV